MPSVKDALPPSQVVWLEAGIPTVPRVARKVAHHFTGAFCTVLVKLSQDRINSEVLYCLLSLRHPKTILHAHLPHWKKITALCFQKYLSYNHDLLKLRPCEKSPSIPPYKTSFKLNERKVQAIGLLKLVFFPDLSHIKKKETS